MINFVPTNLEDKAQVRKWIQQDPFHKADYTDEMADSMLTGAEDCFLACAVKDEGGVVFYLQLKHEGGLVRIGTQFGPSEEVSRSRVAHTITEIMPALRILAASKGAKGLVFYSNSPSLVKFMSRWGFKPTGVDDYVWMFQEKK